MPLDWLKFKRNKSRSAKSRLLSRKKSLARGASLRIASVPNLFNYVPPRQQQLDSAEKLFQALPKVQETSNRRASFYEHLLPGAKEKAKENRRLSFYEGIYSEKSQFLTDLGTSIPRPLTPRRIHTEPTRFIHPNRSRKNLRQPYKRSDYIPVRNAPCPPKSKRFYGDLGDVKQASGLPPISRNSSFKKVPAVEAPEPVHATKIITDQLPRSPIVTQDSANEAPEAEPKARCVSSPALDPNNYEQSKRYSLPVCPEGLKLAKEKRLSYNPSPLQNSLTSLSISTSSQNSMPGRRPVKRRPVGGPRFIDLSANVSKDCLQTAETYPEESKREPSGEGKADDASGDVQQEITTSMIPATEVKESEDPNGEALKPAHAQAKEIHTPEALDEDGKKDINSEVESMPNLEEAHCAEPETITEAVNDGVPEMATETPTALEPQVASEEIAAAELEFSEEAVEDSVNVSEMVSEASTIPESETPVASEVFDAHEKHGVADKVSIVELRQEMNELSIAEETSYMSDASSVYEPIDEPTEAMTPWAHEHVDERFMDSEADGGSLAGTSFFSDQSSHRQESNVLNNCDFQEKDISGSSISNPHNHMTASSFTTAPSSPSMFADAQEEVPDTPFNLEPKRYSFVSMTSDTSTALSDAQTPMRHGSSSPEFSKEYHEGQLATNFFFPQKPSVRLKPQYIPLVSAENDDGQNETMLPAYPSLALRNGNGTNDLPFTHRSSDSYDSLVGYYL